MSTEEPENACLRAMEFPPAEAVVIIRQILESLDAAHLVGVIHRDLKPQNIMVDSDGRALVMDFGIAGSEKSEGLTTTGSILGTPEYVSPEQVFAGARHRQVLRASVRKGE